MAEILIQPEVCAPSVGIKNQVEDRWGGTRGDSSGEDGVRQKDRKRKMDGGCKVAHFAAGVGSSHTTIMDH